MLLLRQPAGLSYRTHQLLCYVVSTAQHMELQHAVAPNLLHSTVHREAPVDYSVVHKHLWTHSRCGAIKFAYFCCYYLLQLSFHSLAVVLTLVQTKQIIYINETIQKHSTDSTKHSKYKYTQYQHTHT
jgi:hypothetical protein